MNYGMYISASGMMTQLARQDVISNNLANVSTTAFRPDSVYIRQREGVRAEDGLSFLPSNQLLERLGGGVMPTPTFVGTASGSLETTGRSLDVGIEGEGYLVVQAGEGREGLRLTRDGRLAVRADGTLVTASEGFAIMGQNDRPIRVDPRAEVVIHSDGLVTQRGAAAGRLQLVDTPDPAQLVKTGRNLLRAPDGLDLQRAPAGGVIHQGKLEQSSVNAIDALMDVESAARSAQGHARILGYYDEIMSQAIGRLGRVS